MSAADAPPAPGGGWPALRVADWTDTRETLHMWTQIVGKLRLAKAPMVNEAAAQHGRWDREALEDDPGRGARAPR